jgi:hypothetical protein
MFSKQKTAAHAHSSAHTTAAAQRSAKTPGARNDISVDLVRTAHGRQAAGTGSGPAGSTGKDKTPAGQGEPADTPAQHAQFANTALSQAILNREALTGQ